MRHVSLVPAVLLTAVVLAAPPAQAGGPTSVLLSVPGADSTTSLYYTDPEYDALADLVGVSQPTGTFGEDSAEEDSAAAESSTPPRQRGAGVTLTWLIHDVEPWRVDRVLLAKDGPWISTQVWTGTRPLMESPVVWHRPADPAGLVAILDRLGLDTRAAQEPGFEGAAGAPISDDPVSVEPAAVSSPPAEESSWTDGARWALAGLAVGLLVALVLNKLVLNKLARTRRGGPATSATEPAPEDVPAEVLVR